MGGMGPKASRPRPVGSDARTSRPPRPARTAGPTPEERRSARAARRRAGVRRAAVGRDDAAGVVRGSGARGDHRGVLGGLRDAGDERVHPLGRPRGVHAAPGLGRRAGDRPARSPGTSRCCASSSTRRTGCRSRCTPTTPRPGRWRASRGARPSAGWWSPARTTPTLILGHTADTADELRQALLDGTLMEHLVTVPVAQDDFFMVNAGEVHSVGPGMLVYEVQQSSDITYRLYDFDRVGPDGRHARAARRQGVLGRERPARPGRGAHRRAVGADPATAGGPGCWWTARSSGSSAGSCSTRTASSRPPGYRVLTVIGGCGDAVHRPAVGRGRPGHQRRHPRRHRARSRLAGDLIAVTTDPGPALA